MQFLDSSPCEAACFAWWSTMISEAHVQLTSNDTTEPETYLGLTSYQARGVDICLFLLIRSKNLGYYFA